MANTFPAAGDRGYAAFQDNQRNFYEELRLSSNDADSRIVWSGGLFFSHLKENVPESIIDPTLNQEIINYTTATYGAPSPLCYARVCNLVSRRAHLQWPGRQRDRQAISRFSASSPSNSPTR